LSVNHCRYQQKYQMTRGISSQNKTAGASAARAAQAFWHRQSSQPESNPAQARIFEEAGQRFLSSFQSSSKWKD
jgi:hypothetical protein